MKIISTNHPVFINGNKESDGGDFASADATEVTSEKNPVVLNGQRLNKPSEYVAASGDDYYGADGNGDVYTMGTAPKEGDSTPDKDEFYSAEGDDFFSMDASDSVEVKAFQDWLDRRGIKWVGATNAKRDNGKILNRGSGYGNFGPSTTKAYLVYGNDWEVVRAAHLPVAPAPLISTQVIPVVENVPQIAVGTQPTASQVQAQRKRGVFWDKAKGAWVTAKQSGVLDWLASTLGIHLDKPLRETPVEDIPLEPRKTSPTVKIVLVVGGLAIIGLIVYSITKKK